MAQFMEDLAVFTTLNHSGYLGQNFIEIKKKLCFFWLRVGLYSEKLLQRPCLRPRVAFLSPRYSFSLYGPPSPNNIYWCHVIGTWTEIGFLRCGTWQIKRLRISFSLFIDFSWRWVGGDVICKLHAFLVDTSHNTSITTLVVIAYLRLKAITDPFNSRSQNFSNKEYIKIVLIWCMCLVISSPTASMNKVETDEDGKLICTNTSWGSTGREIYYTVHAILFFHNWCTL